MRRIALAGLAIGVLAVAGCGSSGGSEAEVQPLNGLQTYASISEMTADLSAGGLDCEKTEVRDTSTYASESIGCWISGKEYVLGIHLSDRDREAQVSVIEEMGELLGEHGIIAGANWTVNCGNKTDCLEVKQVLGGKTSVSG